MIYFFWCNKFPLDLQDCYFACEYHGGYIALRDAKGLYLAPIGSRAALKTRSNTVTKDELFSLEDSLPQASFVAASNTRYVSVKQGRSSRIFTSRAAVRYLNSFTWSIFCRRRCCNDGFRLVAIIAAESLTKHLTRRVHIKNLFESFTTTATFICTCLPRFVGR